jgi:hypothetical protein
MPFSVYDLRNADERIAQVSSYVDRQRERLATLQENSAEADWVAQVLVAMERTLQSFQEHRSRIEAELSRTTGPAQK